MSYPNVRPSDKARLMATIDPDNYANGTYTSDWVPVGQFSGGLRALVAVGDELGASPAPSVTAKLEQATDAAGTGAKDITGKTITTLGANDADKQAIINVHDGELDLANSFAYVRLSVTVAGGTTSLFGAIDGFEPRYSEGDDLASVDSIN